ncbi:hypothetical protein NCAS_0A03490 [Naumovozyma castellii]|uniref:Actin cytoskeleton-regulatory complex protein SLA1 n=1 Tax=Naumovozyma castellii TaxID=27288 RepID=G0V617_NAUCA|nr:hypothetical protein NCAS_0A03490 [Naumovozyma castellii CBS 4309]CCC66907.1 hypothetical protein NCAS_0A03490 [Naumovozyma castellii CBS 4309]
MTVFLGVYKAIYDYEPQTPEELEIHEDDLLYLLEKSEVDEWWTVKKRVIGSDVVEPVGLVPSNYIEEAPAISQMKALYDYTEAQNQEEELTFHENDIFDVYDDKDPDWLLVKSRTSNEVGFIPGNYVEPVGGAPATAPGMVPAIVAASPTTATTNVDVSTFLPPPQRVDRVEQKQETAPKIQEPTPEPEYHDEYNDEEEAPPPKPTRPTSTVEPSRADSHKRRTYYDDESNNNNDRYDNENNYNNRRDTDRYEDTYANDDGYQPEPHTWKVNEIGGRRKHKAKLIIGNNKIHFIPNKGDPQEWSIDKLVSYDKEKKHMFLEFIDPYKSLELHTGNNDTCNEIMSIIGEFKGASRDPGLREVQMATKSKKQARIMFDFIGEAQDELTVKEGDMVYILNDKSSKDWWTCELVDSHKRGVVPAQFVEPVKDKSSSTGLFSSLKKMTKSSLSKSPSKDNTSDWKSDAYQNISPSRNRAQSRSRVGSVSAKRKRSSSASNVNQDRKKEFPDPKKMRLWVDRTGTFKVEAQFIGCAEGKIHLHKSNGVKIAVAANKLSDQDLNYVENVTGFSLDKFKERKGDSGDARDTERERRRKLREKEERERDRRLRERELAELQRARELLEEGAAKLNQEKELPPIKPPRPSSTGPDMTSPNRRQRSGSRAKKDGYDWFEFFLNSGVDVNNCQRYSINFDREQITEDMMSDINPSMLRTLGLREGDIVRVMKYLDNKFGREAQTQVSATTGGLFSEPDGSLKVNNAVTGGQQMSSPPMAQTQSMPLAAAPVTGRDEDAWTVQPAAQSQPNLVAGKSEFTGSMQDLLDLEPLEPKKAVNAAPEPKLAELEPVKTGSSAKQQLAPATTGGTTLVPLDPFKTGGNNYLPMNTTFVMMPFTTGGAFNVPQTSFGMGGILPVQKTNNGLIPIATTGGAMPLTSFASQTTGNLMPLQRTGGLLPLSATGGANIITQTTFGMPPAGSVLPVQKTANGLIAANSTGGLLPLQTTGGMLGLQRTGGLIPQTSFATQLTGGAIPQTSFGAQLTGGAIPQTSFGNQLTGGAFPQTSFGGQLTGGANIIPHTSFAQSTSALPQTSFGMQPTSTFQPQSTFGVTLQKTGGLAPLPQNQFTGGAMQQQQPIMNAFNTGGAMQQQAPMMNTFNTGGAMQQQQPMLNAFNTGGAMQSQGINNLTQGMQNTFISQPSQPQQQIPLQTQPTGFGFGNGPQPQAQQGQQQKQANLLNATAANPFGF